MSYSKESIVKGFREHVTSFLEMIYKEVYPSIYHHIRQNSGSKNDAEDIFQDGMIIILNKINNNNFELTSSFSTFLFSICKHIWLTKLRNEGFVDNGLSDEDVFSDDECLKIDNAILKAKTEIEKAKEYQESLITQVVTGQLKVPCNPDVTKPEAELAKTL